MGAIEIDIDGLLNVVNGIVSHGDLHIVVLNVVISRKKTEKPCLKDQGKILDDILRVMIQGALAQQGEKLEASPVDGYDKVGLLGKGGMGEVWKVRERKTGKILALKTMLPEIAADRKAKDMFLREAGICEFLKHKNVVRTYQTGCADGVFFILMDLCGGGSVEDLMRRNGGKLSLNLATYIILQALDGLDYVHKVDLTTEIKKKGLFGGKQTVSAKGVVHHDFKPGNIFLSDHSDHPVAMVADFGMAKAFQTAGLTDMSAPDQAKGTVPFMPRQRSWTAGLQSRRWMSGPLRRAITIC